jgi:hypothetical protein
MGRDCGPARVLDGLSLELDLVVDSGRGGGTEAGDEDLPLLKDTGR